jgi:acyl-CoA synthetase (AMP-forming)/AMP-acid ligase II
MKDPYTIAGLLQTWAREQPEATMLEDGEMRRARRQQCHSAAQVAEALAADGVEQRDRVAFLDRNGPAYFDVAFGEVAEDHWGETVKAVLVAPGIPPDASARDRERLAAEAIEYCRERLAHDKCPTSVDAVDALPRNFSGKVLERELRQPYWEGRARSIS